MGSDLLLSIGIFVIVVIPSLTIHEYAHARVSSRLGDITPKLQGRLTLNPMAHIDPVGTIAVPLLLTLMGTGVIGRAKPVPINPSAYRKPIFGEFLVAMAGPLSNILLGIVLIVLMVILGNVGVDIGLGWSGSWVIGVIRIAALINFSLAFFNLLPIPPLDGYRIITLIAPQAKERIMENQQRISYALLFVMIVPQLRVYLTSFVMGASMWLYSVVLALLMRI